jgi:hypothetical protein
MNRLSIIIISYYYHIIVIYIVVRDKSSTLYTRLNWNLTRARTAQWIDERIKGGKCID